MVPADPNQKLQGYRVPLVTGTRRPGDELGGSVINDDDLAGSLTYYFDSQHKLQKIVFDGVTGNAERLIRDVATPYGLERTQTTDPSLFLYQRNGWSKSESQLRVRTSELMTRASSNRRFQVWLVLTPKPASWF
jgi:hypothetical protein